VFPRKNLVGKVKCTLSRPSLFFNLFFQSEQNNLNSAKSREGCENEW